MSSDDIFILAVIALVVAGWAGFFIVERKLSKQKKINQQLHEATDHLWQYEKIHDAEQHAKALVKSAEEQAEETQRQAQRQLKAAEVKADTLKMEAEKEKQRILSEGREKGREARERAEAVTAKADRDAAQIINDARRQAEETAGNALKVVENAKLYEQTAKAMRNIIEGYHDDYIVPNADESPRIWRYASHSA